MFGNFLRLAVTIAITASFACASPPFEPGCKNRNPLLIHQDDITKLFGICGRKVSKLMELLDVQDDIVGNVHFRLITDKRGFVSEEVHPNHFGQNSLKHKMNRPLILIAHGFADDTIKEDSLALRILKAYCDADYPDKYNVGTVDWSKLANVQDPTKTDYTEMLKDAARATKNMYLAAERVALFLDHYVKHEHSKRKIDIHLVGVGMGAHLMGMAALLYKEKTGLKIDRITGCDPTGSQFYEFSSDKRLDKKHAEFVDIIHTNNFQFGYGESMGHVDFYVNAGGPIQPHCSPKYNARYPGLVGQEIWCSHKMAAYFFADSITNPIHRGHCTKKCNLELAKFGQKVEVGTIGDYEVEIKHIQQQSAFAFSQKSFF